MYVNSFPRIVNLGCALVLAAGGSAYGQSGVRERAAQARGALEDSIRLQRESVGRQLQAARPKAAPAAVSVVPGPAPAPAREYSFAFDSCDTLDTRAWEPEIKRAAAAFDLSPKLVHAVIETESAFRPCAVSRRGALGLMQLMPQTASELGVYDPLDPRENLFAGVRYLGSLWNRYNGDARLALGAYNAGPTAVDRYQDLPPFPETQAYVRRILALLGQSQFGSER